MTLTIKTDPTGDPLLNDLAKLLGFTAAQLAEVAIYHFLASYLADRDGPEVANGYLQQLIPNTDLMSARLVVDDGNP